MISITVNDPTAADAKVLRAIADVLDGAGGLALRAQHWDKVETTIREALKVPADVLATGTVTTGKISAGSLVANVVSIDPEDNPAAGVVLTSEQPVVDVDPAAALFAAGAPPLPNQQAASIASSATGAVGFTASAISGHVAVSGELPNVQGPTPTPPPLPLPNSQTSTQPLPGAATDSPAPPPPPAPAPAPVSGAVLTTPGVQTDSAGMLWDARIHASTKAIISDGTWKKRRGVEPAVVAVVEAQLREAAAIPTPVTLSRATTGEWPFPPDSSAVTGAAPTFSTMMQYVTERIQNTTLTQEQVTAAVQSVGLQSINLVMSRTDLIPKIMDALRAIAP